MCNRKIYDETAAHEKIRSQKLLPRPFTGLFSPQCRNLTVNFGLVPTVRSIKGRREASFLLCYLVGEQTLNIGTRCGYFALAIFFNIVMMYRDVDSSKIHYQIAVQMAK